MQNGQAPLTESDAIRAAGVKSVAVNGRLFRVFASAVVDHDDQTLVRAFTVITPDLPTMTFDEKTLGTHATHGDSCAANQMLDWILAAANV